MTVKERGSTRKWRKGQASYISGPLTFMLSLNPRSPFRGASTVPARGVTCPSLADDVPGWKLDEDHCRHVCTYMGKAQ